MSKREAPAQINPAERGLYRVLANHLISGLDAQGAAMEMDLPPAHVNRMLLKEEFSVVFREVNPVAFQAWQDHKLADEADKDVQMLARQNAVRNFKALQDLADTADLKASEKAGVLKDLLKVAGALKDDQPAVEVIKVTPTHMAALAAAAREVDAHRN